MTRGEPPSPELPRENVYGHTKKARLVLDSLARRRRETSGGIDVLDVGCGNGAALTRFLAAPGDRVLGIDTHAPSIEYAAQRFGGPGLEFRRQSVESVLAEGRQFDVIILADVLEHLAEPELVLGSSARLLRREGRLLVSVPNGFGPYEIESWLSRLPLLGPASLWVVDHLVAVLNRYVFRGAWSQVVAPSELPYNADSGHVQFFTRTRVLQMAEAAGLTPVRTAGLSWLSGPYTNYLWAPSRLFCRLNTRLADLLPRWMLSAWYFELARGPSIPGSQGQLDQVRP